jgi:hypothetical protein
MDYRPGQSDSAERIRDLLRQMRLPPGQYESYYYPPVSIDTPSTSEPTHVNDEFGMPTVPFHNDDLSGSAHAAGADLMADATGDYDAGRELPPKSSMGPVKGAQPYFGQQPAKQKQQPRGVRSYYDQGHIHKSLGSPFSGNGFGG